jgi:hypothetical protein
METDISVQINAVEQQIVAIQQQMAAITADVEKKNGFVAALQAALQQVKS